MNRALLINTASSLLLAVACGAIGGVLMAYCDAPDWATSAVYYIVSTTAYFSTVGRRAS